MTWLAFFKTPPVRNGAIAGAASLIAGGAASIAGSFEVSSLCQGLLQDGVEAFNQTLTIRAAPAVSFPPEWSEALSNSDMPAYCLAVSLGISLCLTVTFSLALFAAVATLTQLRTQQHEELGFLNLEDYPADLSL